MGGKTGFRYPIPSTPQLSFPLNRLEEVTIEKDPLPLTGWVQGKMASDLEERFARALNRGGIAFIFRQKVALSITIPGHEKEIDFMVECGMACPVEIDGPIAHRTAAQKGADAVREILLNHAFLRRGVQPIQRVKWWQLESQQMANRVVGEMFGGDQ